MKKPRFGEYWVAKLSYRIGNPVHKSIIRINHVGENCVLFTPFCIGESMEFHSNRMQIFELVEKINTETEV